MNIKMKKQFYKVLLCAALTLFVMPFFVSASFDKDLYYGMANDPKVSELQEFLVAEGVYPEAIITGNFYSLTLKAVKAFQAREEIEPVAGYFGPKTRAKANKILSSQIQASENQAVKETGATTEAISTISTASPAIQSLQEQINSLLAQLQKLNEQIQTQTTIQQQTQQSTEQIQQSVQQIQQNAGTTTTTIEITSVKVTPMINSANIEWQTNIPTESKLFLSGGNLFPTVYRSQSGLSTRHIVNVSNLSGGTEYSYEIEAISGEQTKRNYGTFQTIDKSDIIISQNDYGHSCKSFGSWNFTISILDKNGNYIKQATIKIVDPEGKESEIIANSVTASVKTDWKAGYYYNPTTSGQKTLSFSSNGVGKTVTINIPKLIACIDPTIQKTLDNNVIPSTNNYTMTEKSIGSFVFTTGDELVKLDLMEYETDLVGNFQDAHFEISCYASNCANLSLLGETGYGKTMFHNDASGNQNFIIYFSAKDYAKYIGNHYLTIKSIKLIGQNSGQLRYAAGIPITFNFSIE